jgi:hypothetical protein
MKNLQILPVALVWCCCQIADGQTLPRSVISSAGGQFISSAGSLEWSLGEIMTETYSHDGGFLTQGFQQPSRVIVTSLVEDETATLIYPNPVSRFLYVKTASDHEWQVELFDLHGKRMMSPIQKIDDTRIEVDLLGLPTAIYLLGISDIITGAKTYHKVIKH